MAGRIGIEASEKSLNLAAGERGLITLTFTNASNVVDAFDVTINDLDPSWYTLTPNKVSLFPKAKGVSTLQLHPPLNNRHAAGDYPFTVLVTSRDAADETATLPLQITLAESGDLTAELEPQRIVGRQGTFRLVVNNAGNYDRQVVLRPTDNEEKLGFAFGAPQFFPLASAKPKTGPEDETTVYNVAQAQSAGQVLSEAPPQPEWTPPTPESGQGYLTLTIPTATRLEIPLTARRREREWFGMEIPQRIEVNVTPPGVEWEAKDARKANAELVYQPILAWMNGIPLGLRRALAFLIPLLILGLLLFLLLRPQNTNAGAIASQTQTAAALGNAQTQTALALSLSQTQTALAGSGGLSAADQTATARAGGGGLSAADQTATARALSSADQTATALAAGGPLRIVNFDWDSSSGTFQAIWEVAPTEGVTVTINKTPVPPVGSMPFDPSEDRSLILEASNGNDLVSRALGAIHVRAPSIRIFTADAAPGTSVPPGSTVTLSWETTGSERVLLNDAPVDGPNGSIQVTPSSTTEYLLTAENSVGSVISRLTVNVAAP